MKIIIAIDGYAACGKSTLAKALAKALNYTHINTGAMYRATTLYFLQHEINLKDSQAIGQALNQITIHFEPTPDGGLRTFLNHQDVTDEIYKMYISEAVSRVSAISLVRRAMVAQQQAMGRDKGVVLEGRDIGTVVFPEAELKIFMTARPDVRTKRRQLELARKGQPTDFETVKTNLLKRDKMDSNRADSPLRQAVDALVLDNSDLTPEQQLEIALAWARGCMG